MAYDEDQEAFAVTSPDGQEVATAPTIGAARYAVTVLLREGFDMLLVGPRDREPVERWTLGPVMDTLLVAA